MNTNDIIETIKNILQFFLFTIIKNMIIFSFIYLLNFIITSMTLYKTAKFEKRNNAYYAWLPIFRDFLTIEIAQGNKLYFLSVLLFFIPGIRFLGLIPIYIYLSIMKYKIIKNYDGYCNLFIFCDLSPFILLTVSPMLFLRINFLLAIPVMFSLIKTCRNISKHKKT